MTRKLLKRRRWRAGAGPALVAEVHCLDCQCREVFGVPLGKVDPDQLVALAADVEVRAASLADLARIIAASRRKVR